MKDLNHIFTKSMGLLDNLEYHIKNNENSNVITEQLIDLGESF